MAKFKKGPGENVANWISDNIGWAGEFFENLGKFFGIDAKKYLTRWTNYPTDITTLTKAINEAFSHAEIKNAQDADRIQKAADNLIGLAKSPVIRSQVSKLSTKLQNQYQQVLKNTAKTDLEKSKMMNLATDIDSSTFMGLGSTQTAHNYKELQHGVSKVSGGKVIIGDKKYQPELENEVEERL